MITSLQELNEMVVSIANYVVRDACEHTSSGQRFVSLDDALSQYAKENPSFTYDDYLSVKDIVLNTIAERDEVLDVEFNEETEEFDVNCALDYCRYYEWCEGDEETFNCSYDEWLNQPPKPIADQIPPTRADEIAQRSLRFAIEDVGVDDPSGFLRDKLGMTDKEVELTLVAYVARFASEKAVEPKSSIDDKIARAQEKATERSCQDKNDDLML